MDFKAIATANTVHGAEISAYANLTDAPRYMYLISGVHGDEPEGVYVLDKLFAWLQQQNLDLPIIVIPALNRDGLATKTRVNANGIDLNRNWSSKDWTTNFSEARYKPGIMPLSEPENMFLFDLFSKFKPGFIFSFHSWKRVLNHNSKALADAEFIARFNDYPIANDIGYPTPGSLGSYSEDILSCGLITYELPPVDSSLNMDQIWDENRIALENYFLQKRLVD